jgi:ligand-binding sensor domain-containing protein
VIVVAAVVLAQATVVEVFTSTREVTAIVRQPDGRIAVSTRGGLLIRNSDETWSKRPGPVVPTPACSLPNGVPPPPSRGSHVSGVTEIRGVLHVAMYGDGLYKRIENQWQRVETPETDITCLANHDATLWVGTRRHGAFWLEVSGWKQTNHQGEIPDHNIQSLTVLGTDIYACTLEDGLARYANGAWSPVNGLASNAPRQVLRFGGSIYVRHGTGAVDRLTDGRVGRVDRELPRKQATSLATDGKTLFVAQWGGWSEFDGLRWKHRFDVPKLKGVQTTAMAASARYLWVGTQGAGLVRVERETGKVRVFDERDGLEDDWITRLAVRGDSILAATFHGRPALTSAGSVRVLDGPSSVRDIHGDWICDAATLWKLEADGRVRSNPLAADLRDIQTIRQEGDSLWIGCRAGLYRVRL